MALKFGEAQGSAKKSSIDQYTYKEGDNVFRLVGDILPRYVTGSREKMARIFLWNV